jgi:DNA-directed RNA polymerase specialized sigma24 family protein
VIVSQTVVLRLVRKLNVPVSTAEDLAAEAFVLLWERNPEVKKNIVALLYTQGVYRYHDERRILQRDSKRAGKYLADQLDDMLRQDPRADPVDRETSLSGMETAVANAKNAANGALEQAFLDVLLNEKDVFEAKTRWHLKTGRIVAALASRGFEVTPRDVDNMRDRLQRNPDFRSVITLMRNHRGGRPHRTSRASR